MNKDNFSISIVVPTHNEEANVPVLYTRLKAVFDQIQPKDYEIIFVDDSTDSTPVVIKQIIEQDANVNLVKLTRKFGQTVAIAAGLERATGDIILMMDADLQDPPECIPDFIAKWKEGYDVVCARRESSRISFVYYLFSKIFYNLQERVSTLKIPQNVGEFRLIDKKVLKILVSFREKTRFMRGLTLWPGFKYTEIDIQRSERTAGKTNYNFKRSFLVALDGLVSFSITPLRYSLVLGVIMFVLSIIGVLYVVIPRVLSQDGFVWPSGWTLLTLALLVFSGLQFFLLGIIGEYVGRTYIEVIDRPLYVVEYEIRKNTIKKEGSDE